MDLVQLFLPLRDNRGEPYPRELFGQVRAELTERFGGLTAYQRAPAVGLWEDATGAVCRDDVVLFEVLVEELDARWWQDYRGALERCFDQDEVMIRATAVRRL